MSHVDVFNAVYRVFYDWQSSRTRRLVNTILAEMEPAEPLYPVRPRATHLLDGSAVLNWTASGGVLPAIDDLPLIRIQANRRPELVLLTQQERPDSGTPADFILEDGESRPQIVQLTYTETLQAIAWFTALFGNLPGDGVNDFRQLVQAYVANANNTAADPLRRLLELPEVPLNKLGGEMFLPWFHPFEFSNQFVGWELLRLDQNDAPDPNEEVTLWRRPDLGPDLDNATFEEPRGAYLFTQEVRLYSGQRVVGGAGAAVPSFRYRRFHGTEARRSRLGLIAWITPPERHVRRAQQVCVPPTPMGEDEGLAVFSADTTEGPAKGVELRELHIVLSRTQPNADGEGPGRLRAVLDLDGFEDIRVEHVYISDFGRTARCLPNDPAGAHLQNRALRVTTLPVSVVRLGVRHPTQGALFRDCRLGVDFEHSAIRFGTQATQNLWLGGDITTAVGSWRPVGSSIAHWEPQSTGNWMIGGDIEPTVVFARARYLMEGRGGAVESTRVEPATSLKCQQGPIPDFPDGQEARAFRGPLFEAFADVEVGPTGRDNVVQWLQLINGRVVDRGQGSYIRSWDGHFRDRAAGVTAQQSWNNLLQNCRLRADPLTDRIAGWQTRNVGSTRDGFVDGPATAVIAAAPGGFTLSQTVASWGESTLNGSTDDWDNHRLRDDVPNCQALRHTSGASAFEGERQYVATAKIAVARGQVADLLLLARDRNGRELTRDMASVQGPASTMLCTRLRTPPETQTVTVELAGQQAFIVGPVLLYEGTPTVREPDRPVPELGGPIDGPLWLPGANNLITLAVGQLWTAAMATRLISLHVYRLDGGIPRGRGEFSLSFTGIGNALFEAGRVEWDAPPDGRSVPGKLFQLPEGGRPLLTAGNAMLVRTPIEVGDEAEYRMCVAVAQAV